MRRAGTRSCSAVTATAGEFIAFWLSDGRVVGGMNVNVWDVNEHVQELIRSRTPRRRRRADRSGYAARFARDRVGRVNDAGRA